MRNSISFEITNTHGYPEKNGSWSGITGMIQRREIDIGPAMLMMANRMEVVTYVQLYTHTR